MPTWQRFVWIVLCLLLAFLFESGRPLFRKPYNRWRHAMVNFSLLGILVLINAAFGFAVIVSVDFFTTREFGLFYLTNLSIGWQLVITILVLDFLAQYVVHYLLHKVLWMWRLHMVHHSDTKVDVTTGTRHHPLDFLVRESVSLIVILLLGAPIAFYLFYRFVTVFFTYFTHANLDLPRWLDKSLSLIFVTPNMHKFHHHYERPWTDTNFGNVFSVWDRIFGTYVYGDPREVVYGLDVLDPDKDEDFQYQLRIPFDKSIKTDY